MTPRSYLRIDETYEVPVKILKELVDQYGSPLTIRAKHHGGLAELKDHVRHRDRIRKEEVCRKVRRERKEREETLNQAIQAIKNLF